MTPRGPAERFDQSCVGASVRRHAVLGVAAFALVATAVPQAVAQPPRRPEPRELWRQFPLESKRSRPPVSADRKSTPTASMTSRRTAEGGRDGTVLIAGIVAISLVLMLTTGALAYAGRGPLGLGADRRRRLSVRALKEKLGKPPALEESKTKRAEGTAHAEPASLKAKLSMQTSAAKGEMGADNDSETLKDNVDAQPDHGESAARDEVQTLNDKLDPDAGPPKTATPTKDELETLRGERETRPQVETREQNSGEGAASVKDQMRGRQTHAAPGSRPGFTSGGRWLSSEQLSAGLSDEFAAASVTRTDQLAVPDDGRVGPTLVDYLQVLRRRRWIFLLAVTLVPALAVALSMAQAAPYRASAEVLLKPPARADGQPSDPARAAQTAAELARVPEVATRTIRAAGVRDLTASEFLKRSSVSPTLGSDILTFSVMNSDPEIAKRLGTAYARTFSDYQHDLDTQQIRTTQSAIREQMRQLEASGLKGSAQYRVLARKDRELTAQAFGPSTAVVVQEADGTTKVGPKVVRNGLLGLTLGLVLGLVLVFLWDALDTRIRSVETLRAGLGLRLLGRLPSPPRKLRKEDRLVMLAGPRGHEAEAFRVLRASFDYANADYQARTIMFTSAIGEEGKSTTVANLAVALARAGRRVVLIDSDLRRPSLHRFFDLEQRPGLIDIALETVELGEALRSVPVTRFDPTPVNGARPSPRTGKLEVLTAGHVFHAPDELGVELTVARIAESLQGRADLVLIDVAPLLAVGDAIALSAHVDALVLVVRLNGLSSSSYDDLRRTLASLPTPKLGFIVTDAETRDTYTHFYRYSPPDQRGDQESPVAHESSRTPDE